MSEKKYILHMITPQANISPFDVNMACDAGYDVVIPYTGIGAGDVRALVQDAIFSRSPRDAAKTALFIGGRDAVLALDMLANAREAMLPPFEISVFPDPSGSFTTAAAMAACVEKMLMKTHKRSLKGLKVKIYGGKGIVGNITGVLCARAGAQATLVGYDGLANVAERARIMKERFNVDLLAAAGDSEEKNTALLADADVVLCAARAGVQVLSSRQMATAPQILAAADANAVPPAGIEGVAANANGEKLPSGALALGPLAAGDVKVKTQREMLKIMRNAGRAVYHDPLKAMDIARAIVAS